ncbi:MAG: hypothetical protein A2W28_11430 [Gammaproteobacteria bacterium RBG_16_51_14]|nr:MAG: hypothetical protein A2W28_11430 [Gammaproteobacteria bacterium RBG_16_51_14]
MANVTRQHVVNNNFVFILLDFLIKKIDKMLTSHLRAALCVLMKRLPVKIWILHGRCSLVLVHPIK